MSLLQWCTASRKRTAVQDSKSDSIASKKRTIQSRVRLEVESISLRESVLRTTRAWCQIVSLRESVLCSNLTFRSRRTRVRSKWKINSVENIWSFRILIDLILWQILVKIEKLEFALFASMHASRIRCTSFLSISRLSFISLTSLTHLVNLLQSNYIDIESTRSQCEMRDRKYLWDINDAVEWVTTQVVVSHCHSRLHRNAQIKSTCSTMYLLFNSRYQISHRCFISWKVIFRTLHSSNIRSITRSHVLQIDLTSYLKSTNLSNLDSFVSALFASMHSSSRSHFDEKACCSNDSHSRLSIDYESIALKKLVRKL